MAELSANLIALATAHGVATEYWDWRGEYVAVPGPTVVAVLEALGVDASDDGAAGAALAELHADRWRRMLPGCLVRRIDDPSPTTFWVHVPHGDPVNVHLELEDSTPRFDLPQLDRWVDPAELDGGLIGEATFQLPIDLPLGWHTLHAQSGQHHANTTVVVVPAHLELPEVLREGQTWGWMSQLYQLQTEASWGFGDLADLGARCLVRPRPRRRVRADQPAARLRPAPADRTLAIPTGDPTVRQPALSLGHRDARGRPVHHARARPGSRSWPRPSWARRP